ncbi:hypothetical protein F0562_010526 [Nyssa sinensis]|uniref:Uncharacterized protein n=1 Tax=Nyssa sinensis TaxID=561372 RepID=A0A5J4ZYY5_9ASTE|nr:hypothetical protein F0562_010526 [Nyssa sinensis]
MVLPHLLTLHQLFLPQIFDILQLLFPKMLTLLLVELVLPKLLLLMLLLSTLPLSATALAPTPLLASDVLAPSLDVILVVLAPNFCDLVIALPQDVGVAPGLIGLALAAHARAHIVYFNISSNGDTSGS